jgi:polygalacturonase
MNPVLPCTLLALGLVISPAAAQSTCNVHSYGAKGDGTTNDTVAIQKALDDCSAKHGTVLLAGGRFVSGPLAIKSNETLDVEKDAMLLASINRADYKPVTLMRQQTVESFLTIANADHVAIRGGGIIDGRGQVWWDYVKAAKDAGVLGNDHPRPLGLFIDHSKFISVSDITIQNSGMWQIVPYYSSYLEFKNLRVLAPQRGAPNTDGIDPFSSNHILIDHYFSSTGDDNIAIKSGAINSPGPDAPSTDILIRDCTFEAGHGLSIGSEIAGGVQRVAVERIHFNGTDNGIRIKANRDRGADVGLFTFKDITMEGVGTSILISEYYPKAMPDGTVSAAPVTRLTPHFHDILIENLKSTGGNRAGIVIGLPESPVLALTLRNVSIRAAKPMQIGYAEVTLDNVTVTVPDGEGIVTGAEAHVTGK